MLPLPEDHRFREALFEKYFPAEEWEGEFRLASQEAKAISNYTGYTFKEVEELPLSLYLLYKKESWIYNLNRSTEGREFLKTLWRLRQTKADTNAIRDFEGRRG